MSADGINEIIVIKKTCMILVNINRVIKDNVNRKYI